MSETMYRCGAANPYTGSTHITPSANQQVLQTANKLALSDITIDGDADLVAGNIKNGVNIFGVTGNLRQYAEISGNASLVLHTFRTTAQTDTTIAAIDIQIPSGFNITGFCTQNSNYYTYHSGINVFAYNSNSFQTIDPSSCIDSGHLYIPVKRSTAGGTCNYKVFGYY